MKRSLTLIAAALLSSAALAQNAPAESGSPFDALDADKSGSLNQQEAQAHPVVAQNFASADANTDGAITRSEFDAAFTSGQAQPPAAPQPQPPQPE
jgi:Ca2+-binding EF-hand superfamily protein